MKNSFVFALEALWWLAREYFQNPVGHPRSKNYLLHGEWRVQLLWRRTLRLWESGRVSRWLWRQRWLGLLLAASVSLLFASWLATGWPFEAGSLNPIDWLRHELKTGKDKPTNSGAWSLFTVLAGTCIAYAIWYFRDQNNLWQIENSRKDINLKDFQKLAEWASGLHLVEDKITTTQKKVAKNPPETTIAHESAAIPESVVLHTPSRREGSASLQIAAVVQLGAFLQGTFGEQFKKPAFTLLTSIWLALMQKHVDAWQDAFTETLAKGDAASEEEKAAYEQWKQQLRDAAQKTPLAKAITQTLADNHGRALRQHQELLPDLLLAGMSYQLPGLETLELDGLNLNGIQWQGAILIFAQLQGANLSFAQLQGADLRGAELQGVDLRDAPLQGANLSFAQLQGADLRGAKLQGADLSFAQLQGADLSNAKLQGADLSNAKLQDSQLRNVVFDAQTQFEGTSIDDETTIEITKRRMQLPLLTHATRLKLRDQNDLVLPDFRYTEFQAQWDAASQTQRDQAMALAGTTSYFEGDPV